MSSSSVELQNAIFFAIWSSSTGLQTIINLKHLSRSSIKKSGGGFVWSMLDDRAFAARFLAEAGDFFFSLLLK
jgi:hypothetical protein